MRARFKLCSQGHRNSLSARFCWVCGEFLLVKTAVTLHRSEALL